MIYEIDFDGALKCVVDLTDGYFSVIKAEDGNGDPVDIRNVQIEEQKVLFTTEDGVEVADEYEWLWLVRLNTYKKENIRAFMFHNSKDKSKFKIFAQEEKADEYILMNKRLFSLNDIFNSVRGSDEWIELSKQRIND